MSGDPLQQFLALLEKVPDVEALLREAVVREQRCRPAPDGTVTEPRSARAS